MNLVEFKNSLQKYKTATLPKCNYKPILRVVLFTGQFDCPVYHARNYTQWKMYQRILENYVNKGKLK